jgi:TolA-binding protein
MTGKTSEKKNKTESQNTTEDHSSRLEKVEGRISELEDKMEIQGKTEELFIKQLKNCERTMQELTDSIKNQTWESWALKKEKRCKQKEFIIYSTK